MTASAIGDRGVCGTLLYETDDPWPTSVCVVPNGIKHGHLISDVRVDFLAEIDEETGKLLARTMGYMEDEDEA